MKRGVIVLPSILLWGKSAAMHVMGWGFNTQMLVRPHVVINDEGRLGFYLEFLYEQNPMHVADKAFYLLRGTNLLAYWKALLILQKLSLLKEGELGTIYSAAERGYSESAQQEIVAQIGQETYDAIIAAPFPPLMTTILINLLRRGIQIEKGPITQEVRAGTIEWCQDFSELAIMHPREVDARRQAEMRLIERYRPHLAAYREHNDYASKDFFLSMIEQAIVVAVEKGVEQTYGPDIVLGFAITLADMELAFLGDVVGYGGKARIQSLADQAIDRAIEWLLFYFSNARSRSAYQRTIKRLYKNWKTMPDTHPLKTEVVVV